MNPTSATPIHVLHIEAEAGYAGKLRELLAGSPIELQHVGRLDVGLQRLAAGGVDLVLLGLSLPDSQGWDTFARTHTTVPELPIIVLSGMDDEQLAIRAVHEGAQDYLVKAQVTAPLLVRSIHYAIERQQIEDKLGQERNLLRTLIDNLPDLIYAKDTEGRLILNNTAHLRAMGAGTFKEAVGKTVFDYFPRDLAERYFADEQSVIRSGQPLVNREESRGEHAGQQGWVLTTKVPVRDDAGRVTGMVGVTRDITAIKRYERALADERNLLRSLIDSLPEHIYVKDREGRFTTVNLATARFFGVESPDAVIGKTDFDFFHHDVAAPWHGEEQEIMRSGLTLVNREAAVTGPDGKRRWVITTKAPLRDSHQKIVGLVGLNRDITDRKTAEEQLHTLNADLARSQTELLTVFGDLKKSHAELKAAQMQLIDAEKMQAIGRLAAGVAHEVKNPLAIMRMGVDYLGNHEVARQQDIVQVLHDMQDALNRADSVIKGLLDFSAAKELLMIEAGLNAVLEHSLRLVRHELASAGVEVVKQFAPDLPTLRIDPIKIQQVFINIFTNAAQAMTGGGTLTVRTFQRRLEPHEVGTDAGDRSGDRWHAGDTIVVTEVDDTGTGIAADKLAQVFDPFFTTKATGQGQGLGLTVTKKIVELHGGTIALANRPEGGARATVQFKATRRS